ncbi:gamma-glutamylcyclotransferase [Billgrantia diversa]|uniref:gamma-glutamylcyclotransferase family protein n=1 Tax=Halomonas sp. MCCC 1A13316 TaxID=2733487 RepID=UPI0018A51988|nr:gamma-glutamylcyclotransferase family protein [Halomonas sp. MCCC 1A13316]QOR38855.1 gamma-glutamylcyclotransferase [Halomonas sp. MCCC 1A13316]
MRPRPRSLYVVVSLFIVLLAVSGWLWLTMLSPFIYERPDHLPDIKEGEHVVFVYGTLRLAPIRWVVMRRAGETEPAFLEGFRREGLDLTEAPGERVEGEVIVVDADELKRLDRYERLGVRYERVPMRLDDGRMAWVYRRMSELQHPSSVSTNS